MGYLQPGVTDVTPGTWSLLCPTLDFLASKFIQTGPCALFSGFSLSQHCMNLGCGQQSSTAASLAVTPGARETLWGSPVSSSGQENLLKSQHVGFFLSESLQRQGHHTSLTGDKEKGKTPVPQGTSSSLPVQSPAGMKPACSQGSLVQSD